MSAIVGIRFLDGRPVDPSNLGLMLESLAHRGPDGSGVWFRGSVGLGHRMLWTTPESLREKLPLADDTADLVITADARIDNRDELISVLDLKHCVCSNITDSELILRAYAKWGESCPTKLLGDFAFAIWDARRQILFCARDHFGVKPFYYHLSDRAYVFGSEIKALLCLPAVPRRLNEVKVADYLVPIFEDKEITFYHGILRLPPAHTLIVSRTGTQLRSYWALNPAHEILYRSDEEYAEAFRELFTEAVNCRLRSAYPVGSMLSGGLDSSSIVCVARQLLRKKPGGSLHTLSAIFDNTPECDERPFINAVLAQGWIEPHYVHADNFSPLGESGRMLWHQDEPFYAPNLFMHWSLYDAASHHGVRILFDGIDGDTTVSHGIRYLTELARSARWLTLYREAKGLSRHFTDSPMAILVNFGLKPLAPGFVRQAWRVLRRCGRSSSDGTPVIRSDFAQRIGLDDRVQVLTTARSTLPRTAREDHWRALTRGLLPALLEVVDKAAAAFLIKPQYPFFDRRLVEFCLALPPEQKLKGGLTRMVMRRGLASVLPDEIRTRGGKSNIGPNFTRNLLTFDRKVLDDVMLNDPGSIEDYVDMDVLRETYLRYRSGPTEDDALTIWKTATLAQWLRSTAPTPLTSAAAVNERRWN